MSNYPLGAENDPRAPYNEPKPESYVVSVDVEVYLGTTIEVEVQNPMDKNEVYDQVKEAVISKYNIDGEDTCLNDINIWD
jgi:hypothetical protein